MTIALRRTKFRFMARIARFVAAAASDRPPSWGRLAAVTGRDPRPQNRGPKPAIDEGIGKVSP
jgi:hypothetical protein